MMMIEFLLATVIGCSKAEDLILKVQQSRVEHQESIIEVIKSNTEPGCYEGSEHNS